MRTEAARHKEVWENVPDRISNSEILTILQTKDINSEYINTIRDMTDFSDEEISNWLNISVRTLRSYRQPNLTFKESLKEHIILILSLMKHGNQVFGSRDNFDKWLNTGNFFLDGKAPGSFLTTVTGIRFVDDRLTAMEYGDNV